MKKTKYNEKVYLLDPVVYDFFEELGIYNLELWREEKKEYQDVLVNYDKFIEEVATLLHNLGYSSTLECSNMVSYLIRNGFLSHDAFFINQSPDPKGEIVHRLGTSIIMGHGCCRNYSNILKDIFKVLGEYTDNLYCYQGLSRRAYNNPANHVINLIEHEDNLYGIDMYNGNRLFHFKNALLLDEISSRSSFKLYYKPYYEIAMGESNLVIVKDKMTTFKDSSERRIISPYEYENQIKYDAVRRMEDKKSELCYFHEKTKSLKKEIARDMRLHRNKKS